MALLRIACINIERSKHLDLVKAFLDRERPDVVCIQELMGPDCEYIADVTGATQYYFAPMSRIVDTEPDASFGIGIFSHSHIITHGQEYYARTSNTIPESDPKNTNTYNNHNRMILWCDVAKDDSIFRIATTHFTWTPDGSASDEQRRDVSSLLKQLAQMGEFVLCGDFNAPRKMRDGTWGEIFSAIAEHYQDNIPTKYTTSIDGDLHRAGHIPLMVDGLFSTPAYRVSNVVLHNGVSDHCAITADIEIESVS